jgi:hypothetical protein
VQPLLEASAAQIAGSVRALASLSRVLVRHSVRPVDAGISACSQFRGASKLLEYGGELVGRHPAAALVVGRGIDLCEPDEVAANGELNCRQRGWTAAQLLEHLER